MIHNDQAVVFVLCSNVTDAAASLEKFEEDRMVCHGELVFFHNQLNKHNRSAADAVTVCLCNNWSSILLTHPQQSHWYVLVFSRQKALVHYEPSALGLKNGTGFGSTFPVRPLPDKLVHKVDNRPVGFQRPVEIFDMLLKAFAKPGMFGC